jgi:hypothetical protein
VSEATARRRVVLDSPYGKLTIAGGKPGMYETIPNGAIGEELSPGFVLFDGSVGPVVVPSHWIRDAADDGGA